MYSLREPAWRHSWPEAANLKETSSEPYTIKASDLAKKEKELTDFPLMASVKETIQTLDNAEVELIEPGPGGEPGQR